MTNDIDATNTILPLIKQLKSTLLGLQQLRHYVGTGVGQEMLELLIEEERAKLVEAKRKMLQ